MAPSKGFGPHLRQADGPDFSGPDEVAQGPHALLDRHPAVHAMKVEEVDDLHLQPTQAVIAGAADVLRPAGQLPPSLRIGAEAALAGQDELVPARLEGLADQGLVVAEPVDGGGVEEGVAHVEGLVQQPRGLGLRRRVPVGMAQAHAAQADGADVEGAEPTDLHETLSFAVAGARPLIRSRMKAASWRAPKPPRTVRPIRTTTMSWDGMM